MTDELKPCPNEKHETNSIYTLRGRYNWWFVKCLVCGISTNLYETKEKAIAAWNKREDNAL